MTSLEQLKIHLLKLFNGSLCAGLLALIPPPIISFSTINKNTELNYRLCYFSLFALNVNVSAKCISYLGLVYENNRLNKTPYYFWNICEGFPD